MGSAPPLWVSPALERGRVDAPLRACGESGAVTFQIHHPLYPSCPMDHVYHPVLSELGSGVAELMQPAEPAPRRPSTRGPGSCPWEPGAPSKKTALTPESTGDLPGNGPEACKQPGGISSTASWFFEGSARLAWGGAQQSRGQSKGEKGSLRGPSSSLGLKYSSAGRGGTGVSGNPWDQAWSGLRACGHTYEGTYTGTWGTHTYSRGHMRRSA